MAKRVTSVPEKTKQAATGGGTAAAIADDTANPMTTGQAGAVQPSPEQTVTEAGPVLSPQTHRHFHLAFQMWILIALLTVTIALAKYLLMFWFRQ